MKTNSTPCRSVFTFTMYFLLTTFLIHKSIAAIPEEQQDQRNVISIGTKLTTLDDVRLGDYSIKKDDPISSKAHDELRLLLTLLLDFNKQPHDASASLENLVRISKNVMPAFNKKNTDEQILWNSEDQLLLDEQIVLRYNELMKFISSKEQKAMLTYFHAQYLFTNKRTSDGITTLRAIVKDFTGTTYELRAKGELVFRLFVNKKYEESLEHGADIMKRSPNTKESQDALYFRARSRYQLKQYQEAKPSYDEFITKYPTNKWIESAKYFRAKTNSLIGKYETAVQQFSDFIKEYPKSTYRDDAREMMANICLKERDYKKAISMYVLYKKENPDILEQIAADKKIKQYSNSLMFTKEIQANSTLFRYYDSIYAAFPSVMLRYAESDNKAAKAQSYFALVDFYIQNDPEKALQYLKIIDSPLYTTDKPSATPKSKNCLDCDYGLIYRPTLEFMKARIYIQKNDLASLQNVKSYLVKASPALFNQVLLQEIDFLFSKKQFHEAMDKSLTLYNNKSLPSDVRCRALFFAGARSFESGDFVKATQYLQLLIKEFPNESPIEPASWILSQINAHK